MPNPQIDTRVASALGRDNGEGALVAEVMPDSPAAKAGLRAGDLILSMDGKRVNEVKDLQRMVAEIRPGTQVAIAVQRDGAETAVDLVIGQMPSQEMQATAPAPEMGGPSEPSLGLYLAPLTPHAREAQGGWAPTPRGSPGRRGREGQYRGGGRYPPWQPAHHGRQPRRSTARRRWQAVCAGTRRRSQDARASDRR
jgi:membrane-associated protease RseP (regulator of RpoE activity)